MNQGIRSLLLGPYKNNNIFCFNLRRCKFEFGKMKDKEDEDTLKREKSIKVKVVTLRTKFIDEEEK